MPADANPTAPAPAAAPAFPAELVADLQRRLRRFAAFLLGQDAADGIQEACGEVHRAWPGFRGEAQPTTWGHRVAVRALLRFGRRRRRDAERTAPAAALDDATLASFRDDPFEAVAAAERRQRVLAALAALPEHYRAALALRSLEGMDYRAIAETLAVPLGTVKSRIAQGSVLLARALQKEMEP
jgi:RNA polymerase sigma-70 factor (ECF subfamily)